MLFLYHISLKIWFEPSPSTPPPPLCKVHMIFDPHCKSDLGNTDLLSLLFALGSAEQLLSPECWKATLRALGCYAPSGQQGAASVESSVLHSASDVLLSDKQVCSFCSDSLCFLFHFPCREVLNNWNTFKSQCFCFVLGCACMCVCMCVYVRAPWFSFTFASSIPFV